ncbi:fibroblast growth factor receptor substrate 2 [Trichonephila clavipes]|uniref:Fibroblast growth factor receptor substrate 2 n=1 Tax=Trichonephila clavipes TaxID=2585209 RepID=A0A8X6RE98_TRICX|nr:fibroblast growth factor receptor substrate 2 [Trichonephila clavipes]
MGCAFSRTHENNPRIFHVWNVDSDGRPLKPGKIEVTDTQLILYQKANIVVRWPLTSLRRYGFDSELFSFECGRRCTTGAGVYAFKCRRAQALFSLLQECINNSGTTTGNSSTAEDQVTAVTTQNSAELVNSIHSSSVIQNGHILNMPPTSPTVDAFGYLEPNTASNFVHFPTPNSSQRNNSTAGSPGGYICIQGSNNVGAAEGMTTEWPAMPSSLPSCCSLGTCGAKSISASPSTHHYVNNEVIEQSVSCSNSMCIMNRYVNSSVIASDIAHRCCSPTKCCAEQNKNTYVNSAMVTLSPGHLPSSGGLCPMDCTHCLDLNTNYAKLDDLLKQEQSAKKHKEQHFYVNVKPEPAAHSGSSTSSKCVSGRSTPTELHNKCGALTSPTSPSSAKVLSSHCYANLSSSTISEATKEQIQVTYAVLDLDQIDSGTNPIISPVSAPNSLHSLTSSPVKSPEGYAQIDFDKTVALSNSANPCSSFNDDSMRKTRHNAATPCASMTA